MARGARSITRINRASLFFQAESSDEATQTSEEGSAPQKQKGTNYKKRYDDLKRHYDERIAEFKQKEQELLAQAQSAQPTYQPPKSAEELEQFRTDYPDLYETVESVAHLRKSKRSTSPSTKNAGYRRARSNDRTT